MSVRQQVSIDNHNFSNLSLDRPYSKGDNVGDLLDIVACLLHRSDEYLLHPYGLYGEYIEDTWVNCENARTCLSLFL